jgi:hypothetical protein
MKLIKIKCGIVKFLGSYLWVKAGKCIVPKNLISYKFMCIYFIFRHGIQHETHFLLMIPNLNFYQLCIAKTFFFPFNFVLMLPCEGNSSFMGKKFEQKKFTNTLENAHTTRMQFYNSIFATRIVNIIDYR